MIMCHTCYTDQRGDSITLPDGSLFKKALLEKRKNEDEIDEHWVQCDHCEGWVHQICGMFNKGRNTTEDHYLCPSCLLLGMDMGVRQPLQVSLCRMVGIGCLDLFDLGS